MGELSMMIVCFRSRPSLPRSCSASCCACHQPTLRRPLPVGLYVGHACWQVVCCCVSWGPEGRQLGRDVSPPSLCLARTRTLPLRMRESGGGGGKECARARASVMGGGTLTRLFWTLTQDSRNSRWLTTLFVSSKSSSGFAYCANQTSAERLSTPAATAQVRCKERACSTVSPPAPLLGVDATVPLRARQ